MKYQRFVRRCQVREILLSADHTIFYASFIKKDGTIRRIKCRLKVKKHLKGGELGYSPKEKGLLSVYDVENMGYRMINLRTIDTFSVKGESYYVID